MTSLDSVAPTRNCVIPANTRRITTPPARMTPTTPRNTTPVTSVDVATSPSSKRGRMTLSVTHRTATLDSTVQMAKIAAPMTAMMNGRRMQPDHRQNHPGALAEPAVDAGVGRRFHLSLSTGALPSSDVEDQLNVALLVVRLGFGVGLAYHGYNKVFGGGGLAGTSGWFGSIGMRWPAVQARLAAATEITTGLLFAAGLAHPVRRRRNHRPDDRRVSGRSTGTTVSSLPEAVGSSSPPTPWWPGRWRRSGQVGGASTTPWTSSGRAGREPLIAGLLGVGAGAIQLAVCYRPTSSQATT